MREIAPDQDQFWFDIYGRVALTGEPERFENFSTPLDRWFLVYALKIDGAARVALLFDDITDRKRAELELASREQQFQTLLDQAPLGVYLVDSDFVIRQVNPIAAQVFGDIEGGPVGRAFDEVIHLLWDKQYADELVRIFRQTLDSGEPYVTPERAEHRNDLDTVEYYEWRLDRIILPDGRHGVVCYFRDISAQVRARHEIEEQRKFARASEERYRALATVGSSTIYRMSPD
ncbi:MAG: PAS domain-containing protein [Pseudomonadota bacterium]|nr:PAS domain-containing protein [Pseudomonadota bacterium]